MKAAAARAAKRARRTKHLTNAACALVAITLAVSCGVVIGPPPVELSPPPDLPSADGDGGLDLDGLFPGSGGSSAGAGGSPGGGGQASVYECRGDELWVVSCQGCLPSEAFVTVCEGSCFQDAFGATCADGGGGQGGGGGAAGSSGLDETPP